MARPLLQLVVVKNIRELLVAGIGGAVGTALDVTALILLVEYARLPIPAATFLAASAGAGACFSLNKRYAFRDRSKVTLPQIGRFGLVVLGAALLLAGAMQLVAVDLGVPYLLAKALCAAAVFVAWTYPAQRRLVFRARPAPAAGQLAVRSFHSSIRPSPAA